MSLAVVVGLIGSESEVILTWKLTKKQKLVIG